MNGLFISVIAIGVSASFYPFEIMGALSLMATDQPRKNVTLFLLTYNLPVLIVSYLGLSVFGKNAISKAGGSTTLNLIIATTCLLLAFVVFARRNHPKSNQKHDNSLFNKVAKNPIKLGGVVLILNPFVVLFVVAGINVINQASVDNAAKLLALAVLMFCVNITTLALIAAYAYKPRLAKRWVSEGQNFATKYTWQLLFGILILVAIASAAKGFGIIA
jgi:hypothetical protein